MRTRMPVSEHLGLIFDYGVKEWWRYYAWRRAVQDRSGVFRFKSIRVKGPKSDTLTMRDEYRYKETR